MTQQIDIGARLSPATTGTAIGYRIENLDGTAYAAFTTTGVTELDVAGTWHVEAQVTIPDAGAVVYWGTSGNDLLAVKYGPAQATSADLATVDTVVDGIKAVTDNLPDSGALSSLATQASVDALPSSSDVVTALMAYALESGKTVQVAWLDIWSVIVGNASADDANNPTSITYDSPDDTVQRTHALTSTARTVT